MLTTNSYNSSVLKVSVEEDSKITRYGEDHDD